MTTGNDAQVSEQVDGQELTEAQVRAHLGQILATGALQAARKRRMRAEADAHSETEVSGE